MTSYIAGFSLGLSLILAIGSQNAFILKQGIKNQHVFIICAVCAISDAILISMGVAGFGVLINEFPQIELAARYAGALFLFIYAFLSFKSAFTANHALDTHIQSPHSLKKTIAMSLAFTWLNPHVYLDTVVLLGSISTQYQPHQFEFGLGAVTASFVFFFSLGYFSKFLAPLFSQPKSWKILEFLVGLTMLLLALSLIFNN
ncbi:LysE/ArgO family amino acid transporter [Shewanella donghaensis]|uniref:LysE/ArgO family amino acid transporter n=1 Tax=Shewanella donghaensis TaxID=238836 RepID=UPI001181D78C|nr:LysE/ArgO family amino acid transporter [Shewanella donghaensis]